MSNLLSSNNLYTSLPNLVIGFHGCDQDVFEKILYHHEPFKPSKNSYDWLGNGMYFWEQNLERAWEWAKNGLNNPKLHIKKPAVIGAVIDLGNCLNLLDSECIKIVRNGYKIFSISMILSGKELPTNRDTSTSKNLMIRELDCAVIESILENRTRLKEPPFDSVRGVFVEGDPVYDNSGFMDKSHIQICIRNPNCIKGFFAPREIDKKWRIP